MAPGLIDTPPTAPGLAGDLPPPTLANKAIFHDGYKTTGQLEPVAEAIFPYEQFPKEITGPTVWKAEDYRDSPEKWTHAFTQDEILELGTAADNFIASGVPLTGITKERFPLPTLAPFMESLRQRLINAQGFWLFRNIPVQAWGNHKSAAAYMGLGTYLGYFTSQNSRGHVLGHVKDLGEDSSATDRVRIYRTNARQYFHTDASDLVGLLCMAKSMEGGESDIVSMHHVFNILQSQYPDVAKTFCERIWYFDRKGEVSQGQEPWMKASVFYLEPNPPEGRQPRVYGRFDPMNVTSLRRFSDAGKIPPLSEKQLYAIETLEKVCLSQSLHMILDPGDIQFLSNSQVFHARTAYKDWAPGTRDEEGKERPRRHLMRLWLSVPLDEGGWKLPYPDAHEKKRGGIQVDDTPPVCPLDAE